MRRIFNWRLVFFLAVAILAAAALINLPALHKQLLHLTGWLRANPVAGAVVLGAMFIPAAVLFVPGSLISLTAGYSLGLVTGTIAMSLGSTAGACAAFLAGRTIARGWVEKRIAGSRRFQALDQGVAREGFKIVLLTRLSPAFPFNLLNYAFGLTQVRFRDYALASWVGMFPGTVMYVYLGTAAGEIAQVLAGEVQPEEGPRYILLTIGLIATIIVTIVLTRIARNALKKTSPEIITTPAGPTDEPTASNSSG